MNKGIPFWEQHIEKMVLGLAAVVMLAVLAAIAIDYDAVTAEIDNRTLAPAEVDEVMVGKARALSRQLQPDAEAETEQFLAVDGSGGSAFRARLSGSTAPSTMPPPPGGSPPNFSSLIQRSDILAPDLLLCLQGLHQIWLSM